MKTLLCKEPLQLEYIETDSPVAAAGYSIIKIKRIGVCGTDIHAYGGNQPYFTYPRVLGHEIAAEFVSGDATGFEPGDALTIIPYFSCGTCIACRTGHPNCCVRINVCGVHVDGGMREFLSVPSSSLLPANGLSLDELALVEPLAIARHGIRRANVQPGEQVLVIGAGPIGMGLAVFAKIAGAIVTMMDVRDDRLAFCKDKLGIDQVVNAITEDASAAIHSFTQGDMCSVVIDATGNLKAINNALQYLAHAGRYVLVGLQKEAFSFSHPDFHKRETTLMSSRNATKEDFEYVIESIQQGKVNANVFITHRTSFEKAKADFESLCDPASEVVKAVIEFA